MTRLNATMRRMVPLGNFHPTETLCRCGKCGKDVSPVLMLRVQALIYILIEIYRAPIRFIVSGPARCAARNRQTYKGEDRESYHLGINRIDEGTDAAAIDGVIQLFRHGRWRTIPKAEVAEHAVASRLFGGVGWKVYPRRFTFVHFDLGPVRTF